METRATGLSWWIIAAALGAVTVAVVMVFVRTIAEPPERFPSWAERGFPPPGASGFIPASPPPPRSYTVCGIAGAENCWETPIRR